MTVNLMRLKGERVAKGLSQQDVAEKMGWKRSSYAKRENGLTDIGANELIKIAEILGYGPNDLHIFFTDNVPERKHP
ncbi:TPA: helix-turn-helix domain-containing protein [Streptococcus suis]